MSAEYTKIDELLAKEEQTLQTARSLQALLQDINIGYSQALQALDGLKGEIEVKLEDFNNKKQTLESNMLNSSKALGLFYQKVEEITPKIEEVKQIASSVEEKKGEIDTIYEGVLQIEQSVKEVKALIDRASEELDLPSFVREATAKRDEILSGLTNDINTLLEQQKAIFRDILNQLNSAAENAVSEIERAGVQMNSIRDGAIDAVNEAKSNALGEIAETKDTALYEIKNETNNSITRIQALVPSSKLRKTLRNIVFCGYSYPAYQVVMDGDNGEVPVHFFIDHTKNSSIQKTFIVDGVETMSVSASGFIGITDRKTSIKTLNTFKGVGSGVYEVDFGSEIKKALAGHIIFMVLLKNGELYINGQINGVSTHGNFIKHQDGVDDAIAPYLVYFTQGNNLSRVAPFSGSGVIHRFSSKPKLYQSIYIGGIAANDSEVVMDTDGRFYNMTGVAEFKEGRYGPTFKLPNGNIGYPVNNQMKDTGLPYIDGEVFHCFHFKNSVITGGNDIGIGVTPSDLSMQGVQEIKEAKPFYAIVEVSNQDIKGNGGYGI